MGRLFQQSFTKEIIVTDAHMRMGLSVIIHWSIDNFPAATILNKNYCPSPCSDQPPVGRQLWEGHQESLSIQYWN